MTVETNDWLHCPTAGIGRFSDLTCCTQVHRHDYFTLIWLQHGNARLFVDFAYQDMTAGSLMCIAPGQVHAWEGTAMSSEVGIAFTAELFVLQGQTLPRFLDNLAFEAGSPYLVRVPGVRRPLFSFVFGTAAERCNDENDPRRYEETLLTYLNVALLEMRRLDHSPSEDGRGAGRDDGLGGASPHTASSQLTRSFRRSVEAHLFDRRKVHEYASMLGVSTNHLVQTVRRQTSRTPGRILQDRLVLEAKRLLIHTDDSVAEIAIALSFPNPSQFGRWFKHCVSVSPGEFRRQFAVFV